MIELSGGAEDTLYVLFGLVLVKQVKFPPKIGRAHV